MQLRMVLLLFGIFVLMTALNVAAQSGQQPASALDYKGVTSYTEFQASTNSLGQVFEWDTSVGYNFSRHLGVDVGLPLYYASPSSTASSGTSSGMGAGDVYLDMRITYPNEVLNYGSKITLGAPTGSTDKGFSTGRATIDWNNHFDRSFGRLTPFGEAGLANTVTDTRYFARPFTSLGFVTHFQGGMTVDFARVFQAGGSVYAIAPSGSQKVYSKLVGPQSGSTTSAPAPMGTGKGQGNNVFASAHVTSGGADLVRDHGYTAFLIASPVKYMDLEVAYTRSADYQLNTVSFSVGFNVGVLAKSTNRH
jgi:hypothetical protein